MQVLAERAALDLLAAGEVDVLAGLDAEVIDAFRDRVVGRDSAEWRSCP